MDIGRKVDTTYSWGNAESVYVEIGGEPVVRRLADEFYDTIEETSPELQAMLPDDTTDTRVKLFEFLSGWMGGPPLFHERRGHPALRMRHAPFAIAAHEAAEWVRCMNEAIAKTGIEAQPAEFLGRELARVAVHLRNRA